MDTNNWIPWRLQEKKRLQPVTHILEDLEIVNLFDCQFISNPMFSNIFFYFYEPSKRLLVNGIIEICSHCERMLHDFCKHKCNDHVVVNSLAIDKKKIIALPRCRCSLWFHSSMILKCTGECIVRWQEQGIHLFLSHLISIIHQYDFTEEFPSLFSMLFPMCKYVLAVETKYFPRYFTMACEGLLGDFLSPSRVVIWKMKLLFFRSWIWPEVAFS